MWKHAFVRNAYIQVIGLGTPLLSFEYLDCRNSLFCLPAAHSTTEGSQRFDGNSRASWTTQRLQQQRTGKAFYVLKKKTLWPLERRAPSAEPRPIQQKLALTLQGFPSLTRSFFAGLQMRNSFCKHTLGKKILSITETRHLVRCCFLYVRNAVVSTVLPLPHSRPF